MYTSQVFIDFHTHVLPPAIIEGRVAYLERDATLRSLFGNPNAVMATAEDLIAAMDGAEVDRAVALGMGWTDRDVARLVNDYLLESAERYKERLIPFCTVNPLWGDAALQEVERCARAGARGIGELHPDSQGYSLADGAVTRPMMELAGTLGLTVLTHASEPMGHTYPGKGRTTPDVLLAFIERYPDVSIVCAHWGGGLPFYALMPEVRRALANASFDTSVSPFLYDKAIFDLAPAAVGAERVLFGSDFPLLRPGRVIDQVKQSRLSQEQQAAILGGNAERLLRLE